MNFEAFVINLDRRTDRYARFSSIFNDFGFKYTRFSAFDGKNIINSDELNDFERDLLSHIVINPKNPKNQVAGIFGCWLSHYNLWKRLHEDDNNDFYVIFEDDVYVTNDFEDRYEGILRAVDDEFDIYYLGGRYKESFMPKSLVNWEVVHKDGVDFYYSTRQHALDYDHDRGLFSYVVTKSGSIKILSLLENYLQSNTTIAAVDGWINEHRHAIKLCDTFPHVTWAKVGESSDIR